MSNDAAADNLQQEHGVYGDADAVVGIREVSGRPDGEETEYEDDGQEDCSKDIELSMLRNSPARS